MTEVAVRCTKCALACVNGCTKKTRKTRARQTHTDLKGDRGAWRGCMRVWGHGSALLYTMLNLGSVQQVA
jgi:hypothetical protein